MTDSAGGVYTLPLAEVVVQGPSCTGGWEPTLCAEGRWQ